MAVVPVLLDVLAVGVIAVAAWTGWRRGAAYFVPGMLGVLLGLFAGLWVASRVVGHGLSPVVHLTLSLLCGLAGVIAGSAAGAWAARRLAPVLARHPRAQLPDRIAGIVVRGLTATIACWLVAAVAVSLGPAGWSATVSRTTLLSRPGGPVPLAQPIAEGLTVGLRDVAPADVAALVPAPHVTLPDAATVAAVRRAVGGSVVQLAASGCGGSVLGSGFVAGREGDDALVVTNAHVVRRADHVTVSASGIGDLSATTVVFDSAADLAVLRVAGLDRAALRLAADDPPNATRAVLLGYPDGGPLRARPAAIVQRLPVAAPNWSDGFGVHESYLLDADVHHGNSGGPLLDVHGRVIGVVNALSSYAAQRGYAITVDELRPDLSASRRRTAAVAVGTCA